MPPELLGPTGLLIALLLAVAALWRDHLRADADDRAQRDQAIAGWQAQTAATDRVADATIALSEAIRARAQDDAARHRQEDRTG